METCKILSTDSIPFLSFSYQAQLFLIRYSQRTSLADYQPVVKCEQFEPDDAPGGQDRSVQIFDEMVARPA